MLEPHEDVVDDLAECLGADEAPAFHINGAMRVRDSRTILRQNYDRVLAIDFTVPKNNARFWYVSEEKLKPRLRDRATEDGVELEQPLCIARLAVDLATTLNVWDDDDAVAAALLAHPKHRDMARRVQVAQNHPSAEVRSNLAAKSMLPIDLLRCFPKTRSHPCAEKLPLMDDRWRSN